ncbi:MAG: TIGR00341 family protein [Desulfovibrio sp.]|uniref:TIGR00341 family protein n=1 Tax=Desulfovibrio sp. 7SRBS1 TaxID=3378064 RepID=UPI003B41381F
MGLRVIEIVAPRADKEEVLSSLEMHREDGGYVFWSFPLEDDDAVSFRIVLDVSETEDILDTLESMFSWKEEYRIVVYAAEATLPRLENPQEKDKENEKNTEANGNGKAKNRISREELYADILDMTTLSTNYVLLVLLSSLVAIIGLMRNNVAIIIGAMVLAPLLGPNVGLALATTLGDSKLSLESVKTLAVGVLLSFALAGVAGLLFMGPRITDELMARTVTDYSDIILAMVSGAAGIITVTQGVPTSLVGVMVALSLLPPLTASGLFLGAGMYTQAVGAGLQFGANVICLNLAGVVIFLVQGIRPLSWWEKERAKNATLRAAAMWTILLAALLGVLFFKTR